jgi:alcohol/geraniol dehydrogenase (NADP+)
MTTTVHAYAVHEPGGRLEPTEFELGPLGATQVDVDVLNCGICYSDVSMIDNDWGFSSYPIIPGHEIIGTVRSVGEHVTHLSTGDVVGIGWHASYCMACQQCMAGDHNLCAHAQSTFIGRAGGYADVVRADAAAAFKLPDNVDPNTAGPLMCGGITVFSPLSQLNISPTARVGVVGIGGLGHLAVKFARAWGCEVTAFTSTEAKVREARELGAHHVLNSRDPEAIASAADSFDLLISTVNVELDWGALLGTLRRRGRLHVLGAVPEPLTIPLQSLMATQRSVSSSPAGRPSDIANMLDFAGRHGIRPVTETFSFDRINEAIDHVRDGKARYRVVLEH